MEQVIPRRQHPPSPLVGGVNRRRRVQKAVLSKNSEQLPFVRVGPRPALMRWDLDFYGLRSGQIPENALYAPRIHQIPGKKNHMSNSRNDFLESG